jgi:hypothetical protein
VLDKVTGRSATDPYQVEPGKAGRASGQQVDASVPAVEGGGAGPDVRNKLKRSPADDDDGQENVHGDSQIAHGVALDVATRKDIVPGVPISLQRRSTIEKDKVIHENPLAGDGHQKPTSCCGFQGKVRDRMQIQVADRSNDVHVHMASLFTNLTVQTSHGLTMAA